MSCPDENRIAALFDGTLSPDERAAMVAHAELCDACHDLLADIERETPREESLREGSVPEVVGPGWMLQPREQLSRFKIIRPLGKGAAGQVFLARDTELGRRVAIKLLHLDPAVDAEAVDRFFHEARITARFNHPHIVTIHEVGMHQGRPFVALEYIDGQTLRERLQQGPFAPREVLQIGLAVATALEEAHHNQINHGDLKPENILIPRDGRLRVVDFGMAGMAQTPQIDSLHQRGAEGAGAEEGGVVRGTPAYMAPEQWMPRSSCAASDVWALGVILIEILIGRRPFSAMDSEGLRQEVLDLERQRDMTLRGGAFQDLWQLALGCLRQSPGERPTAAELVRSINTRLNELRRAPTHPHPETCPFMGLHPFLEEQAPFFFGRDREISAFLQRLRHAPVLPILGSTGSGKSSFVRAGVIPRLREQGPLKVLELRPGSQPFFHLANALKRAAPGSADAGISVVEMAQTLQSTTLLLALRLQEITEDCGGPVLLYIDQLEELYTLVRDPAVRRAFMDAICTAADDPLQSPRVIFTLREEFISRLATSDVVREALGNAVVLTPPSPETLELILSRQAEAGGYRFAPPELVSQMVTEVGEEPACLPLLQFAAQEFWEQRDTSSRTLTREVFEQMGGVAGALASHADGVMHQMDATEMSLARALLLRLVTPERMRKNTTRHQLLAGLGENASIVLARLIRARLITVLRKDTLSISPSSSGDECSDHDGENPDDQLELVHESLSTVWSRLSRWIDESREDLAFLDEVGQASDLWHRRGMRREELWQGAALAEARRAASRCTASVPPRVLEFLDAGQQRQRRRDLFRRGGALVAFVGVVFVAVAFAMGEREALRQKVDAQNLEQIARLERNEAQLAAARSALSSQQMLQSRAQLRMALESRDSAAARLFWWHLQQQPLIWSRSSKERSYDVEYSPRGDWLVTSSYLGRVNVLDPHTGKVIKLLRGHHDQVRTLDISPDGRWLAAGALDGQVIVWDTESWRRRHTLRLPSGDMILSLTFSPDSKLLAAGSGSGALKVWELAQGRQLPAFNGARGATFGLSFSPDGRWLATSGKDNPIRIWIVDSGQLVREIRNPEPIHRLSFSPDGKQIAAAGQGAAIRFWDPGSGELVKTIMGRITSVQDFDYSPDGKLIAVSSQSGEQRVGIWEVSSGRFIAELPDTGRFAFVAFSPGGKHLVSTGPRTKCWNVEQLHRLREDDHPLNPLHSLAFSPDGRRIVAGGVGDSILMWDAQSGRIKARMTGAGTIFSLVFDPLGRFFASAGSNQLIQLWDGQTGAPSRMLGGHQDTIFSQAISPDGRFLASGGSDQKIMIWRLPAGELVGSLPQPEKYIFALRFSADGSMLLASGTNGSVFLWDWKKRRLVNRYKDGRLIVGDVAFNRDRDEVVSASADGTLRRRTLPAGKLLDEKSFSGRMYTIVGHPLQDLFGGGSSDGRLRLLDGRLKTLWVTQAHRKENNATCFAPSGQLLATCSDDGTVRLWEAATGNPFWRAPALLPGPPRLLTHRGWLALAATGPEQWFKMPDSEWHRALKQRARRAVQYSAGGQLCLWTYDGQLEVWATENDKLIQQLPAKDLQQLVATEQGCLALIKGEVFRLEGTRTVQVEGLGRATAIAADGGTLLAATARGEVLQLQPQRKRLLQTTGRGKVIGLARTASSLYLGMADGELMRYRTGTKGAGSGLRFEGVPPSRPTRLSPGPAGALIVGFENGAVGIWDANGHPVFLKYLYGSVTHLLGDGERQYIATDLGDWRVLDLSSLTIDYCELMGQVWSEIPIIFHQGDPSPKGPPANHRCLQRGIQN